MTAHEVDSSDEAVFESGLADPRGTGNFSPALNGEGMPLNFETQGAPEASRTLLIYSLSVYPDDGG